MATFTKNNRTGEYDVIGLVGELNADCPVEVTKKDGSKTRVTIGRVSKPFSAKFGPLKGRQCVIGSVKKETALTDRRMNGQPYVLSPRRRECKCCGTDLVSGQYRRDGICWDCVAGVPD